MKAALILIDLINEIIDDQGKLASKGYAAFVRTHDVIAKINAAIAKARTAQVPIIFVRLGFSPDYQECPESSPLLGSAKKFAALQLGTWATEIHPSIKIVEADLLITKHRVSAFYDTSLEAILRELTIDTVFLGGVATDLAIQSAAREAHDRDFRVVILEDLCAAANDEDHTQALRLLSKVATISKSAEFPN